MNNIMRSQPHSPILERYGDFIYDAVLTFITDPLRGEQTFRSILRKLPREIKSSLGTPLEVPTALQSIHREIVRFATSHQSAHPDSLFGEKTRITPEDRLKHFDRYFKALPITDRWILFCEVKHSFASDQIATSLKIPESSYTLIREQALRSLERGIWQ